MCSFSAGSPLTESLRDFLSSQLSFLLALVTGNSFDALAAGPFYSLKQPEYTLIMLKVDDSVCTTK